MDTYLLFRRLENEIIDFQQGGQMLLNLIGIPI